MSIAPLQRPRIRRGAVALVLALVASTLTLGATQHTAAASASNISSLKFYGSELIWQPGQTQPVHDTATNTVSSFGPIKDVVCGTVVTFLQEIVMASTGTDNVLEISYEFGYDTSANEPIGLRDIVGLTIHPDSTDLDSDAAVSLVSESVTPNPDVPGTVRIYEPVIEVSGLDANETIWVQIDVVVGCDPDAGSSGTAQAVLADAVETTSGEPLGGGSQTIPGLAPQALPAWGLDKQAVDSDGNPITTADPFQEVTFIFTITNTGLLDLPTPTLSDSNCTLITFEGGDDNTNTVIDPSSPKWPEATFDIPPTVPAETWQWECTEVIGSGDHSNTVTVTGLPPEGVSPIEDSLSFPVNPKVTEVTVTKTASPEYFEAGDTVTWTIQADNTGNAPLESVVVSDPDCPSSTFVAASDTDSDGVLDTDEVWEWTCTSPVLSATFTNRARVDAQDPEGTATFDGAEATATIIDITLDKIAPAGPISAPGDVTYSFLVTNTGDATLDPIAVSDPLTGPVSCPMTALAPTEFTTCTATYSVTQDDIDAGVINNSATVTGTAPDGASTTSASDTATSSPLQSPSWTVAKSTSSTPSVEGDTLVYEFEVDNTGNVSIASVAVTDAKCSSAPVLTAGDADLDGELDPDEVWTFECTSIGVTQDEVDAGEVINNVSVAGTPAGGTLASATDSLTTPITPAPSWTVAKSTSSTPSVEGDTLVYEFEVDNTGNVSIASVTVADAKCSSAPVLTAGDADLDGELNPDEVWTFECTSIGVTQDEVDAGEVINNVSVAGTPAGGTLANATDSLTTPITPAPSWTVAKSTTSTPSVEGDTLVYEFEVDNTGNVSVLGLTVTDAKCATAPTLTGGDADLDGELDPDEIWTFECTSVGVTQDEVDAGEVINNVSVSGTPAGGTLTSATDSLTTPISPAPAWTVAKSTTSTPSVEGDTLVYEFEVDNTGNVSIAGVTVTDAKCAATPVLTGGDADLDGELDPDEIWTFSCTSIGVTQDEVDAGEVINNVSVAGTPAGGTLASATDSLTTPITPAPAWTVAKSTTSTPSVEGDTLVYEFEVDNTGNVSIAGVTVTDAKCSSAPVLTAGDADLDGELDPDEVWTFSCPSIGVTQDEVDAGEVINNVSVSGTPAGGTLANATDSLTTPITQAPAWTVAKSTTSTPSVEGDTLAYEFEVDNNGNVSIASVTVTDAKCAATPVLTGGDADLDGELDPNEIWTFSCTSIGVTQDEVDAGEVINNVSVSGTPAGGTLANATDSLTTPITPAPAWTVAKSTTSTPSVEGDTLVYEFEVDNTGNVSIAGVTVTDAKCAAAPTLTGGDADLDGELDPDEIWTFSCPSVGLTQDEVDAGEVINNVSVSGTPAGGALPNATDSLTTPITPAPAWVVEKSTTSAPTAPGQTLVYEFNVDNTGNVSISGVTVTDAKCASAPTLDGGDTDLDGELDPDELWTYSCTSIGVTQAEVDAGEVINDVSVAGTPAGGTLTDALDTLTTPITPTPSWTVTKAATSVPAAAGDTVEYTFTIVNTGNVTISGVTINDPKCATTPTLDLESGIANGTLEAAETQVWSCTSIGVTQDEVDAGEVLNEVTITGTPANGTLDPAVDDHRIDITGTPLWTMTKSTSAAPTAAGQTLDYSFTIVNTGNVSISGISIADAKCSSAPTLASETITADGVLEVGETQIWTCTSIPVTQDEVDAGTVDNSATASGTPTQGTLTPAPGSSSTAIPALPGWDLTKSTSSVPTGADDTLAYTFTLENTGNVTITAPAVTDAKCDGGPTYQSGDVNIDGELDPGETFTFTCTSIGVTQAEVDAEEVINTADAAGTPARGVLPAESAVLTTPIAATPEWSMTKATSSTPTAAGQTLDYSFTIVNSGNVTITGVTVTDAKCAASPVLDQESITADGVLEVGETQIWICTSIPVTQDEVDAGQVLNTASAIGTPAAGTLDPTGDNHLVTIDRTPSFVVTKSSPSTPTAAGQTLEYSFTVVNSGNVSISGVTITDAKCATTPVLDQESITADGVLEVGETQIWLCTSIAATQDEVDAGQVDNAVTVTGTPAGGTLAPADDLHTVFITPAPDWNVVKSTTSMPSAEGDTLVYRFDVANSGNVTITGVTVTDAKCATAPALQSGDVDTDGELDVGETWVYTCTSVGVTQDEVDAGEVINTVTVDGTPAGGTLSPAATTLTTPITPTPAWSVIKSSSSTPTGAGQTLEYSFSVVNTGNVTITAVNIIDPKCATAPVLDQESITADGVLEPGETQIWTCTSIAVTQDEVDAGQVDNAVTVTGTPAGGTLPSASTTHSVTLTPGPDWTLIKSTTTVPSAAGDTLAYTLTLLNTGNVTISNVDVTDPKCAAAPVLDSESVLPGGVLEVGETQVWLCTSIPVTQDEVDAGSVDNTATATGDPAGGTLDDALGVLSTPIVPAPAWTVSKAIDAAPSEAGATPTYTFTLTNDGNVSIANIIIEDPKCDGAPTFLGTDTDLDAELDPTEIWSWSCTSIPVTQTEVDTGAVDNTVTVVGDPVGGTLDPTSDSLSTPIVADPSWSVVKSTPSIPTAAGQTLDYSFVIINTGNVTITVLTVTDPKCAAAPTLDSESLVADGILQVGEQQTWICTSIGVTQEEIDAGQVDNAVVVTGTPAGGTLPPAEDDHTAFLTPTPAWELIKSTTSSPFTVGDTLSYTFTLANTGNVTVSAVIPSDPKCASTPVLVNESLIADGILQVGEIQTWTCTSIGVTQDEVDAGQVDNVATFTGTPAGGTLAPAVGTDSTTITAAPSWTLAKATSSVPSEAGDTLIYTFTLVNTGNVTISSPVVNDAKCASAPLVVSESVTTDGHLEYGETQQWSCTSIPVTQEEVDTGEVVNSATATGSPAGGTLPDAPATLTTPVNASASFTVTKASPASVGGAGVTLPYTFTVVNTGTVTITDVTIDDPKCGTTPALVSESITADGELEVGEAQEWSCTSIAVTQEEIDAGSVDNTVVVTGTPSVGTLDPATDDHTIPAVAAPAVQVIKATSSAPTVAGDQLIYRFTVVNTGNVTVSGVAVSDAKCATTPSIDSESVLGGGLLEVGETQIWSCTSIPVTQDEVDAGQVDNLATFTGTPAGGTLPPVDATLSTPITPAPSWGLAKTSSSAPTAAGQTLVYEFTVTNTGNVSIAAPSLVDAKCASAPVLVEGDTDLDGALDVTEVWRFECTSIPVTQDEVDAGQVDNTASATGTPAGGTLDPAVDSHVVPISPAPAFTVTKASSSIPLAAGNTLDYSFTLVNQGNVTIANPIVSDPKCAASPVLDQESITADGLLEVGETQIWICTSIPVTQDEVDAGQVDNEVTVTGTPSGGTLAPTSDTHTVFIASGPAATIVKAAQNAVTAAGQTIDYTFTVVNVGNVSLSSGAVIDAKCVNPPVLISESIATDGVLEVGETQIWSCTSIPVTQDEIDAGTVTNTAAYVASPPAGELPTTEDVELVDVVATPAWNLQKSTTSTPASAGDTLEYSFELVNTGNVTIAGATVNDAKCATAPTVVSESIFADNVLQVGETQTWSCTSIPVTQDEVDAEQVVNTATATGTPARGTLPPAESTISTPIIAAPALTAVKTSTETAIVAGASIEYRFTVVNTGNVTIAAVSVSDPKCATAPTVVSESVFADNILQVGETQVWSCLSIPVTQDEVDAGEVLNAATVTGTPAAGVLDPGATSHRIGVNAEPSLEVIKATASAPTAAGDRLIYSFTVINDGNVTVNAVTLADPKCDGGPTIDSESITADGNAAPGETQIWSCTSIPVTQQEIDAGQILNTVVASGTPAGGVLDPAEGSNRVDVPAQPAFSLVKATDSTPAAAGDTLEYRFELTNTGNVTIVGVGVADAKCADTPALVFESLFADQILQVGETQIWSCTSIPVTQAEADAGQVFNTAVATGTPPGGVLPPAETTITTPVTSEGAIALIKSADEIVDVNLNGLVDAGDLASWNFTVINTGTVTLNNVTVNDSLAVVSGGPIASLAPGEVDSTTFTAAHTLTQAELDTGVIFNAAVAVSQAPDGSLVDDVSDSADPTDSGSVDEFGTPVLDADGNPVPDADPTNDPTSLVLPQTPDLDLLKVGLYNDANDNGVIDAGDVIEYRFTVSNIGTVTLTDLTINDPLVTVVGGPLASLAPGAADSTTFSATLEITTAHLDNGGVTNAAIAVGSAPDGTTVDDASDDPTNDTNADPDGDGNPDDPTLTRLEPTPSLELIKRVVSEPVSQTGDVIDYEFLITNDGTVTLTDVVVTDPMIDANLAVCDPSTDPALASMAPGQTVSCTASYVVTQQDVDAGGVTNSAIVAGVDPSDEETTDTSDSGSRTPPGNDGSGSDDPTWEQIVADPELTLTKRVAGTSPDPILEPGGTINYSFLVTNTGNVTIGDLAVNDPLVAVNCPSPFGPIAPGGTVTCTAGYAVTQADIDRGSVRNQAIASGLDPAGRSVADLSDSTSLTPPGNDGTGNDDPTWLPLEAQPALRLWKTVASFSGNGDGTWNITWIFEIANAGNVSVANLQITDDFGAGFPAPGGYEITDTAVSAGSCTSNPDFDGGFDQELLTGSDLLAPGDACTITVASVIDPAGRTKVANTAIASGIDPSGATVDDVSDAGDEAVETPDLAGGTDGDPTNDPTVIDLSEDPGIGVAKAISDGPAAFGDRWMMTFRLTVENVGDRPLSRVQLIEDLDAAFDGAPYTIDDLSVEAGPCSVNPQFDGRNNTSLFSGEDTVGVGEGCVVDLSVSVEPSGRFIGENQVSVSGVSPGGTTVTDLSTVGTAVDPDEDGTPDEEAPNPFVLAPPAAPDLEIDRAPGTSVTLDPLVNDGGGVPLDPTTVELVDPETGTIAGKRLVAFGGVWTVDPVSGFVTFTPSPGFGGNPSPIAYRVTIAETDVVLESTIAVTYVQFYFFDDPEPEPEPERPPTPEPEQPLAYTGSQPTLFAALAMLLFLLGGSLIVARRHQDSELLVEG